jgi:hypothetical protein
MQYSPFLLQRKLPKEIILYSSVLLSYKCILMKGTGVLRVILDPHSDGSEYDSLSYLLICLFTNQYLYLYQRLSFGHVNNNMPLPHWIGAHVKL